MTAERLRSPASLLDVTISRDSAGLTVSARTTQGRDVRARLGIDVVQDLKTFTTIIAKAAAAGVWLDQAHIRLAQRLHAAILGGDVGILLGSTEAGASASVLVRLVLVDNTNDAELSLHDVPWEALCAPNTTKNFLGAVPEVCLVRYVAMTGGSGGGREVRSSIKHLAIAPEGVNACMSLKDALQPHIENGEMVANYILGEQARGRYLPDGLSRAGNVDIVHFVGHAGVASDNGAPFLLVGKDDEDAAQHLSVEVFAQQLRVSSTSTPRLIVLECCEGAKRGDVASAGEFIVKAGADAVLAHLFPVRAAVAARISARFYANLLHAKRGDVAWAMQKARLDLLTDADYQTAAVFSPVVYLRSTIRSAQIFDLSNQNVSAPQKKAVVTVDQDPRVERLVTLLGEPFSLILGDAREEQRPFVEVFRQKLQQKLAGVPLGEWSSIEDAGALAGLPTSALAQQFAFREGSGELSLAFDASRETYGNNLHQANVENPLCSVIRAIGLRLSPGIHVTLLHEPFLEDSIARTNPSCPLFVLRPAPPRENSDKALLWKRVGEKWKRASFSDRELNPDGAMLVVHLLGGKMHADDETSPWITEDDYLHGLRDLEDLFPKDVAIQIEGYLQRRPALCLGLSLRRWHHRATLQRIFTRGIPPKSLAIVEPTHQEQTLWENGAGLPGKYKPFAVAINTPALLGLAPLQGNGS